MLVYDNHSDTVIIVLHEIYGINDHILEVCKTLAKRKFDVIAPELLGEGVVFRYDQEQVAYHQFRQQVGFDRALVQVKQILQEASLRYRRVYVLGFSIGATLAWRCSQTGLCDLVIGFYGSRIRDYLEIKPACPTLLLFPDEEKSFAIEALVLKLGRVKKLIIKKVGGKHGFADRFTPNYNTRSSRIAAREVLRFMKKWCD